jgi:hypothetical protein
MIINPTFWLVLTKISVIDLVVIMKDLGQMLTGEFVNCAVKIINAPTENKTTTDGIFLYKRITVSARAMKANINDIVVKMDRRWFLFLD